jgi:hypothetical protein
MTHVRLLEARGSGKLGDFPKGVMSALLEHLRSHARYAHVRVSTSTSQRTDMPNRCVRDSLAKHVHHM